MKKMTCVHPRRAYNLMKSFINTASDMIYMIDDETEKAEILLHKGDSFMALLGECINYDSEQEIYYNFPELWAESSKIFREYWCAKCPMLKGFSDITISLLHELGHLETNDAVREYFPIHTRYLAIKGAEAIASNYKELNFIYFDLPDEKAATEWAIEWLSDAENRKITKKFEKEFFKCFE